MIWLGWYWKRWAKLLEKVGFETFLIFWAFTYLELFRISIFLIHLLGSGLSG